MRLRQLMAPAILVVSAFAEVRIEQPSPYMSSPPPAAADTTVIDPGRRPNCEVQPGIAEAWYADWSLSKDRPSAGPLDIKAPQKGKGTFRAAFDDNGWPTEVVYYDTKGRSRWTKLFRYPAQIPSGPGEVSYSVNWIGSNGKAILMSRIAEQYKAAKWAVGMKKYDVGDLLGEPLIIDANAGGGAISGKSESWIYWVDGEEVVFEFDKNNRLVSLPKAGLAAPAEVAPLVPAVKDSMKVDSTKSAPAQEPAKSKGKAVKAK